MNEKQKVSAGRRRTREEVQKLVGEFVSSGMRRTEFCRSRGLSFGTLDRHLKKQAGRGRVEELLRSAGWCRWSWPAGNRRRNTNQVAGWPWCCRADAGSR